MGQTRRRSVGAPAERRHQSTHPHRKDTAALVRELATHDLGLAGFSVPAEAPDLWRDALRCCSPNKLHEYLAARLPVLSWNAPNLAEAANRVNPGTALAGSGAGLLGLSPEQLAAGLSGVVVDVPAYEDQREGFLAFLDRSG